MTFPQVLEVAIGLVLLYYVLGSVVSALTQLMMDVQEARGSAMEMSLSRVFGNDISNILNFPQIRSLQPVKYNNLTGIFTGNTERKKVEKIPVPMLVNALFDYSGLTVLVNPNPRTLVKHINILAESDARSALTEWVKLGITNVEYLRQRVTEYLTGVMNAVEDRFSAYTRTFMVKLALIVTLVLGIDTFQVAGELWRNSDLRAVSSAVSILATDQGGQAAASAADSIDLGGLSIKIGWLANDHPVKASVVVWTIYIIVKILGLGITTACVAQGSAFWFGLLKKLD